MSQRLPELIEPLRMAETQRILTGNIPLATMKRLASLLTDSMGDVSVDLAFGVDETGQANVTGRVQTRLTMQCQRCMQPMRVDIDAEVSLAIVGAGYPVEQLASYYEPLIVEEDPIALSDLVEDEVLLALPPVPMHEPDACEVQVVYRAGNNSNSSADNEELSQKRNPFAVLEQLRKKDR